MLIDENLKYNQQIDNIVNKINRSLGALNRASHYVSLKSRITI